MAVWSTISARGLEHFPVWNGDVDRYLDAVDLKDGCSLDQERFQKNGRPGTSVESPLMPT